MDLVTYFALKRRITRQISNRMLAKAQEKKTHAALLAGTDVSNTACVLLVVYK